MLLVVAIAVAVAASAVLGHQLGSASARPPATAKQLLIENPYDIAGSWYKGNLHVASVRGLGRDLPSAIGQWYLAHGFSFLGITDMNTFTWTSEYGSRQLTAVPRSMRVTRLATCSRWAWITGSRRSRCKPASTG